MTSWFCIRTLPGAQLPQRQYEVETTALGADGKPRGKGYRITPSLTPNISAIERALADAGYQFYMPTEFRVIRNRKKTGVYERRRFALLPGYCFVYDVSNFEKLRAVPGVAGLLVSIIGDQRIPLKIPLWDIMTMRTIEAKSQTKADKEVQALNSAERAQLSKTATKALAAAKRKLGAGQRVKVLWGKSVGLNATLLGWDEHQQLKAIVDGLEAGAVEEISVPYDSVKLVA